MRRLSISFHCYCYCCCYCCSCCSRCCCCWFWGLRSAAAAVAAVAAAAAQSASWSVAAFQKQQQQQKIQQISKSCCTVSLEGNRSSRCRVVAGYDITAVAADVDCSDSSGVCGKLNANCRFGLLLNDFCNCFQLTWKMNFLKLLQCAIQIWKCLKSMTNAYIKCRTVDGLGDGLVLELRLKFRSWVWNGHCICSQPKSKSKFGYVKAKSKLHSMSNFESCPNPIWNKNWRRNLC